MTIRIYRAKHGTKHDLGKTHPESPDRLFAIDDQLLASGLDMICEHADASAIAEPYLQLAHDPITLKAFSSALRKLTLVTKRKRCIQVINKRLPA